MHKCARLKIEFVVVLIIYLTVLQSAYSMIYCRNFVLSAIFANRKCPSSAPTKRSQRVQCLIPRRRDLKTKMSTRYEGAVFGRSRCKQGGGTVVCCVIAGDRAYVDIRCILYSTQVINIIILIVE